MATESRIVKPRYAALYLPSSGAGLDPEHLIEAGQDRLRQIAQAFSPRYECPCDDLVVMDVTGLERLFAPRTGRAMPPEPGFGAEPRLVRAAVGDEVEPRLEKTIGEELMRAAKQQGVGGQVAIAGTHSAALVLARMRLGVTVVPPGGEASALAMVPIDRVAPLLDRVWLAGRDGVKTSRGTATPARRGTTLAATRVDPAIFAQWGLRTLGDLAALPSADLTARLGQQALVWQAIARGEDVCPLVPTEPEERFDGALDLEWPIEGLEPLSFVLTRLLEPLSTRLERRDRGAAVLHVALDLVSREVYRRRLQLPTPIRDVRTLRTLILLDVEAHPPPAAIDRVEVVIDPTPGRVLQHTLFTHALPTPERLSTLLARVGAVMGHDRIGAPATVDTHRPGAFEIRPFSTTPEPGAQHLAPSARQLLSALRRYRQPVPARVTLEAGRPRRVTTDRRGFCGGVVVSASGPWRTSGWWWAGTPDGGPRTEGARAASSSAAGGSAWNRDEWDVSLSDAAVYRVFHDRDTGGWFIDGVFD